MKARLLICCIAIASPFCNVTLLSQNVFDALKFSMLEPSATARVAGVGGAFTALGADISVANTNPAGIAEFRKSEFTFSLGAPFISSSGTLAGTRNTASDRAIQLDNLGAVFAYEPFNPNIKSANIAIGFNKIAEFRTRTRYSGNSPGTIAERFLEQATGQTPAELDAFEGGPAFDAGVIFNFDNGSEYDTDFRTFREVIAREQTIETRGTMHELFVTYASNVKNKFSYGFTLGIPIARLNENKFYAESDPGQQVPIFESLNFDERLSISGVGINLKAGIIYKITPRTRIAAAVHSPTFMALEDTYYTEINYAINSPAGFERFQGSSGDLEPFEYNITTPFRAIIGLGHVYSLSNELKGFLTADVEYVDFRRISFNLGGNDPINQFIERDLNDAASRQFDQVINIKVGTELAMNNLRFRAGANMLGTPTKNATVKPNLGLSGGLGYRGDEFYVDISAQYSSVSGRYSPYALIEESRNQFIGIDNNRLHFRITLGKKL